MHWLSPLFKRGAVFIPDKYRGLNLTAVLSKVVERILARVPTLFFTQTGAYGRSHRAFQKKIGCKDFILVLIFRWLLACQRKHKVAIFLSDINGAFDKIHKDRLLLKLRRCGLCAKLLKFFSSYLDPRSAVVIVDGAASDPFPLMDMVFQGHVLGPCLWNIFFTDVSTRVIDAGFVATKFADDLSASREFPRVTPNGNIMATLRLPSCRSQLGCP